MPVFGGERGPLLGVDLPARPLPVHNRLVLAGWAVACTGVAAVRVRIGGRSFTASYGLPANGTLDDLADWPDGSHPRFELALDTSSWERGDHPFEVTAIDRDGRTASMAGVADVQPYGDPPFGGKAIGAALASGAPVVVCETPDVFVARTGCVPLEVTGWAVARAGIDRIVATVDGRARVVVPHGMPRPDLDDRLGAEVAATAGFAVRLDPVDCPPGWRSLAVVAVDGDGRAVGVAGPVDCLPANGSPADEAPAAPATPGGEDLDTGERFVPELHRERTFAAEHYARYQWAAGLVDGGRVLDAGCGVGWGTALLAERADAAVGVDVAPVALAESERRHGDVATFAAGDLCDLPFPDGEFDVVVSFEAIEHVADPHRALDELRRVLRSGGVLLVSSPNRGVYPEGNPFHLRELTSGELRDALASRFANVRVYGQQTFSASLLASSEELAADDPARPLGAEVSKLVGTPPGREVYAVAVAGDGELPHPPARVVLGDRLDIGEERRQTARWRARAERAESTAAYRGAS